MKLMGLFLLLFTQLAFATPDFPNVTEDVFVIGHLKPDSDAVLSSIAAAHTNSIRVFLSPLLPFLYPPYPKEQPTSCFSGKFFSSKCIQL